MTVRFSGRLARSLLAAVATTTLTLVPAASAASPPENVPLGVKTHCSGFSQQGNKKITNTIASVFSMSGTATGRDTNRLVFQSMAVVGDISTGGVFVESRAIRLGGFFRDSHGRQHGRLLVHRGLKVIGTGLTYTIHSGKKNELMRSTTGSFLRTEKIGKKHFMVYDFVAPRTAHVDTFDISAINPKPRTSGKEPVFHKTNFFTTGKTFDFGPEEFNFNLQSDVLPDRHCNLRARSYAIRDDGTETATSRLDVSASKTATSLLISTTVRKPARTMLTLCSSSNKKERELTHAIVAATTNGNQLVTCVAPRGNRFEEGNLYALDPTVPGAQASAARNPLRSHAPVTARSLMEAATR